MSKKKHVTGLGVMDINLFVDGNGVGDGGTGRTRIGGGGPG